MSIKEKLEAMDYVCSRCTDRFHVYNSDICGTRALLIPAETRYKKCALLQGRIKNIEEIENKLEKMAQWADEHPKNLWRDAKKELPPEDESDGVGTGLSIDCLVIAKEGESYCIVQAWYDYNGKCWYEKWDFNQTHIEGSVITHWMPIPELPKADKE